MDISKRAAKYAFATVLTSLTLGTLATPPPAQAATLTGVIASTITLTGACAINGSVISAVGSSFGTLDFGIHPTLFTEASAQVNGIASTPMTFQCNSSTAPTLTVVSGVNDSHATNGNTHSMANTLAGKYVSYSLYKDAAHTSVIANGTPFFTSKNDGSSETVNIYGKAVGGAGLVPGLYTDIVTVQIDF
ncbi:Csu type fimbrial protein [Zophobihabitans entericus]|uniref:Spore coat protein U domain-containing protein n=1 Tax=Zophobihabitans entericus TaxID=1635327 RepID=A0A6G9I964_9GAMM|nr:spore coat protein U domain-containing protein [Zophobihabitans entericus]QIQ20761.1 spore coat protein U domain-containing protein [Zophobihabitans entericus]